MSGSETDTEESQAVNFRLLHTFRGHTNAISSVRFSPSGHYLASAGYDKLINIWNVDNGCFKTCFSAHQEGISEIAWSHDGHFIVSASDDRTVKIWNAENGRCERTLIGHDNVVFCTRFSSENLIASGSDDFTVKVWDAETGACQRTLTNHYDRIVSVDFYHSRNWVLSASHDGYCYLHDLRATTPAVKYSFARRRSDNILSFVNVSPCEKYLIIGRFNKPLALWDINANRRVQKYRGHKNSKFCLTSSFLGTKYVVSGSEDKLVYIWDMNKPKRVQKMEGHRDTVISVDCQGDRNLIASGSLEYDQTVKIWTM